MALGIGVGHLNFGDVPQNAGSAVTGIHDLEQLRRLVDKPGVALAVDEHRVCQNIGDEGILVLTPRTRTSLMARADLRQAAAKVRSQLVTFTSSES